MDQGSVRGQKSTTKRRWQRDFFAALAVIAVLCVAAFFIPVLDGPNSRRTAREAIAVGKLRRLADLQNRFAAAHPEKGFTCQLPLLKSTAPFPSDYDSDRFLLLDIHLGYRIKIDGCEPNQQGLITRYWATAVPVEPGKSGVRAFCTDESGALWYDNGGSADNCLARRRPIE
jgi:hypothetical protein